MQPTSGVFAEWRRTVSREATVFVATSVVLVILGFAYHAQTARSHEADFIYSATQTRVHTALRRGRSGLWEWDLSRGAIFWSPSMFEMLGLEPENRLLSVDEVAALTHPDDADLVELADGLIRDGEGTFDREFRMRRADGHWVWIRARCEVVADAEDEPHLVGIAVDVTEQRRLAEESRTADMRLRDAIEAISEAFVLWDATNRLVLCNSKYQQLHGLPDDAGQAGNALFADQARTAAGRPSPTIFPSKAPARARSRRGSRTAAGCRSTSGAPMTAASSPSAPTSRR